MIYVYKTQDLSEKDWHEIVRGFNDSFDRNNSIESMQKYYAATILGYSYHALDYTEDGQLRGYNSIVPTLYDYHGKEILVGISGGTFVNKEFRKDVFIFKHLMTALFDYCRQEGMVMKVGVPNKNSFTYAIKINKAKLVGYLNYYILPLKAFNLLSKPSLRAFNFLSIIFCHIIRLISFCQSTISRNNSRRATFEIKCDENFYNVRFRQRDGYIECTKGRFHGFYKVFKENDYYAAYIMDYRENEEKTASALHYLVGEILRREKQLSAILYVGTINHSQLSLLKVPKRYEPKPLPLTVNVINGDDDMEKQALTLNSWDFGLINFDVR